VAGALQDAGRATLIGTVTYGKGSVQLPHNLSNDAILRVTIARWFTPADRTIDGVGLTPDIEVAISDEELDAGLDPQLEAALDFLEVGTAGLPAR
jgi:carboxyl-terminal processing protease